MAGQKVPAVKGCGPMDREQARQSLVGAHAPTGRRRGRRVRQTALLAAGLAFSTLVVACAGSVAGEAQRGAGVVVSSAPLPPSPVEPSPTGGGITDSEPSPETTESAPDTSTSAESETATSAGTTGESTPSTTGSGTEFDPFPTTPTPYPNQPTSEASAGALEGRRMAEWVALPIMVDKKFTNNGGISTLPLRGPNALGILFSDQAVESVAERNGMLAGFSSSASAEDQADMVVAVLSFPNDAAAIKAATQMAQATKDASSKQVEIPGQPKAIGWSLSSEYSRAVHTFLADGAEVVYVWTSEPPKGKTDLTKLVAKAYDVQLPELKDFVPTPASAMMSMPPDPEGLLARTLPNDPDSSTVIDGNYSARGFIHFTLNPLQDQALYEKAGVDVVARRGSTMYRAEDAAGATMVVDDFIGQISEVYPDMTEFDIPAGADSGKCLQNALGAQYYCVGQFDRYAVEMWQESEAEMEQAIAAQGSLLEGF